MNTQGPPVPKTPASLAGVAARCAESVKIGLLHSLSGTMALSEKPLLDAEQMAIDEINRAGGVLGRRIEPVIADGASLPERFAQAAQDLLVAGVTALFGCWTSASRKAVRPVVEAAGSLLWYPVQYEGLEESSCICYTGSCLNQQIMPSVEWTLEQFGNRLFLLGSDYVFPRTANQLIRSLVAGRGGSIVGERYVTLGARDFGEVIAQIRQTQPSAVINTLNGDSNLAFYQQYRAAGILPAQIPIVATSVTEIELESVATMAAGHFACWSYFQSLDTPENREFVSRFKGRYDENRLVSAPMVTAYIQLYLWKQAAERAGVFAPSEVRRRLPGCGLLSPMGELRIEANHHLSMPVRIGRLNPDGQFEIVWRKDELIAPLPWLGVENTNFLGKAMVLQSLAAFSEGVDHRCLLEHEIGERKALEAALEQAKAELEGKVKERARQLEKSISDLSQEVTKRQRAEEALRRSHAAALNMMEDAVEARRQAEQTAVDLRREITESKRAEEALRQSEERHRAIIQTAMDGFWLVDAQRRLLEVNETYCRMSGYSAPELLAMHIPDLEAVETDEDTARHIHKITAQNDDRFESRHRRKDGSIYDVEVSVQNRPDGGQYVAFLRDITNRKKAEAEALRYQIQLEVIYDNAPLMMCLVNEQREVERMNRAMAELAGPPPTEGAPRHPGDCLGCLNTLDDPAGCGAGPQCRTCALRLAMLETLQTGRPKRGVETTLFLARQGARREVRLSASTALVRIAGEAKLLLCLEDITTRKQLEQQFLQAQKMEAVGQLAGGVAHDFNNILAAMILHLHLLGETHASDAGIAGALKELQDYAERAADVTRQLLLFSRRQAIQTKRLDVNEVMAGLIKMLVRLLGEHIEVAFQPAPEAQWVDADAGMLEQVVMNLCVNARDAMPKGGRLTLGTATVEIGPEEAQHQTDARVGHFVCMVFSDTGHGMDEATLKRIFEPFFATKEVGKGTGLGLASVYGIVRQHQGWVSVTSSVGVGTTFHAYLPQTAAPEISITEKKSTAMPRGSETILLVEDEPSLLKLGATVLRRCGYRVLEARSGVEGLRVWEESGGQAHLVLTDMIMPGGVSGLELIERLRRSKPGLKVIISSGYSLELVQQGVASSARVRFIAKPYAPAALAQAVREALDEKAL